MPEKTRTHTARQSIDSFAEFDDYQLRNTMRNFLEEEEKEPASVWNFATIIGIAMFLVSMFYILDLIGLQIGSGFSGLVPVLPFIGAILIAFIGFGFFVGDRKRVKKAFKKQKEQRKDYFEKEFPAGKYDSDEDIDLEKELFGSSSKKKTKKTFSKNTFDRYALHQSKKLYKSRTSKKISGVCAGLAKYLGISTTVVRVLFVVTFFASSGTTLIAYIALAIALDKEPPELAHDFDY